MGVSALEVVSVPDKERQVGDGGAPALDIGLQSKQNLESVCSTKLCIEDSKAKKK